MGVGGGEDKCLQIICVHTIRMLIRIHTTRLVPPSFLVNRRADLVNTEKNKALSSQSRFTMRPQCDHRETVRVSRRRIFNPRRPLHHKPHLTPRRHKAPKRSGV